MVKKTGNTPEAAPRRALNPHALPERPGVYLFKDAQHKVLYIGKAVNLRRRVSQYFQASQDNEKVLFFRSRITHIETIVTGSELEALVLEDSLIKQEKPLFNVRLKDDKTYPFVVVTAERFPRIFLTRTTGVKGCHYYGPFTDVTTIRHLMAQLHRVFRLRTCAGDIQADYARPCLEYQIGRCTGPCIGAISDARYREDAARFEAALKGRTAEVSEQLTGRMKEASDALRFEEAQEFKQALLSINHLADRQKVVSAEPVNRDIVATLAEDDSLHLQLWKIRAGRLTEQHHGEVKLHRQSEEEALEHFLLRYYPRTLDLPRELVLPFAPTNGPLLEKWFRETLGKAVNLHTPQRGDKLAQMELVRENLKERLRQEMGLKSLRDLGLKLLMDLLELPAPPRVMEAYDISTLQGAFTVGARSCFKDGRPFKKGYRKYLLRTVQGQDDYKSLQEVLTRRIHPSGDTPPEPPPDIMLIDGGPGQLSHAAEVVEASGFSTCLISLAKREELVYVWGRKQPLRLRAGHEGLALLVKMRDEVHRFAVNYHRLLRKKALIENLAVAGLKEAAHKKPGSLHHNAPLKLAKEWADVARVEEETETGGTKGERAG